MKKNALILSAVFGLSILLSTPKAQAITFNQKMLGAAVIAVIIIAAILAKKGKGGDDSQGHSHDGPCKPGWHEENGTCVRD